MVCLPLDKIRCLIANLIHCILPHNHSCFTLADDIARDPPTCLFVLRSAAFSLIHQLLHEIHKETQHLCIKKQQHPKTFNV